MTSPAEILDAEFEEAPKEPVLDGVEERMSDDDVQARVKKHALLRALCDVLPPAQALTLARIVVRGALTPEEWFDFGVWCKDVVRASLAHDPDVANRYLGMLDGATVEALLVLLGYDASWAKMPEGGR
jgi:hypothetical protein